MTNGRSGRGRRGLYIGLTLAIAVAVALCFTSDAEESPDQGAAPEVTAPAADTVAP